MKSSFLKRPSRRPVRSRFRRLRWSPASASIRRAPGLELEYLKCDLVARAQRQNAEPHLAAALLLAAEEAADLAQATGLPLLVFPVLFEELGLAAVLRAEYRWQGRF
ncbi:MAG: hypothetical protein RMK20_16245 [Verrucomicrobiales bacterium]|nr:hypothetical protein [Verrucomicrobiales bacterium]